MKALLVWPKFESFSFWNFEKVCELVGVKYMTPPLGLLTVGALLPESWELRLVDENVKMLEDTDLAWADIVLVGSKIVHRSRAVDVIRRAKEMDKPVALGGPDPTMSPQAYEGLGVDYLFFGEAELTIPMFLADFEKGVTHGVYQSDDLPDLRETPPPRFDLINHKDYLYIGVQYSRGCPYRCEFCNVIDLFKNKYRTKTLEQVLAEFDILYNLGYRGQVDFFDDNMVGQMNDVKPFLRGIAAWLKAHKYPFQLSTSLTLNVAKDPELLDLLREARFKYFLVGIETPDEEALKSAKKPHNTGYSIAEATDLIYTRAGATVHSGFLLGLDGEPDDIGDKIIDCIDEACVPWVMAGVVYPLPGTQLAKRLDREGRLFPEAREMLDDVRDQVSAGIQFKPQRPAKDVLADLVRIMRHSFDPKQYFGRCSRVAQRLNTLPNLVPSFRIFFRNLRTFGRLIRTVLGRKSLRGSFFKGLFQVMTRNPRGLEAYATLSVLYMHFDSMLPYCYEQLAKQQEAIECEGEDAWVARNMDRLPTIKVA